MQDGSTAEAISFTMPSGRMFVIVDTWDSASGFTLQVTCSGDVTPAEDCDNGVDDDGDGQTDCWDSNCTNDPFCRAEPGDEICVNGADDDGDGFTDCYDSDCADDPGCQAGGEICGNGVDDDGDGHTDCADSDCTPGCAAPTGATPRDGDFYGTGGCAGVTATPAVLAALLLIRRRRRRR